MSKVDLGSMRETASVLQSFNADGSNAAEPMDLFSAGNLLLLAADELALARAVVEAATCPNITYEYPAPCERCLTCEALAAYRAKVGGSK